MSLRSRLTLLTMTLFVPALAVAQGTAHREVPEPKSVQEACNLVREESRQLRQLLRKPQLDGVDLHQIHMITYGLRVGVNYLNRRWDALAQELEEFHENAEKGVADETRRQAEAFLRDWRALHCPAPKR